MRRRARHLLRPLHRDGLRGVPPAARRRGAQPGRGGRYVLRPTNLAQAGIWGTADLNDTTYGNCERRGDARWTSPVISIESKLVNTKLTDINMGLDEFIEHSFYDEWTKTGPQRYRTDPLRDP